MPNGSPLGSTTVLDAMTRILSRMKVVEPDDNIKVKILSELNLQQRNLAQKLRKDADIKDLYLYTASISFVNGECTWASVESANPIISDFERIEAVQSDGTKWGVVAYVDQSAFANLNQFPYFDNSLIYTIRGRSFQLFGGQNIDTTQFTYKTIYTREVNVLANANDLLDVPNFHTDDLINAVLSIIAPTEKETPVA